MDLRPLRKFLPKKLLRYERVLNLHKQRGIGARLIAKELNDISVPVAQRYINNRSRPYKNIPPWILEDELHGSQRDALLLNVAGTLSDFTRLIKGYTITFTTSSICLAVPVYMAQSILGLQRATSLALDEYQYRYKGNLHRTNEIKIVLCCHIMATLCRKIYEEPTVLFQCLDEEELAKLIKFAFAFDGSITANPLAAQIIITYSERAHILKFFKEVLTDYFGIDCRIHPSKRRYLALSIWRKNDVEKFCDKIGIFGWKGVKLEDCVNHRIAARKVVIPEHYVFKGKRMGWVPMEVATLYDVLKAPLGDVKLKFLTELYRLFLPNLFTSRDRREFKHLITPRIKAIKSNDY